MAAMYAPHALEPARWIAGDGFQLQPDGPPYRILKRQKFEAVASREVLHFEGCRALYRLPGPPAPGGLPDSGEWAWDGALRVAVQVHLAPPDGLLRRATDLLCGATGARLNPALNILPEVLDRAVHPEFEVVILDLRGGQTLGEIQAEGWADPMVATPFSPAGAKAIVRRLLELNVLLGQSGLCLPQLHPEQVMIDGNLNVRIRGMPLLVPAQTDGSLAPADRTALAALLTGTAPTGPALVRSAEDRSQNRAPGGWLMHRWLAALVHYLATGRYPTDVAAAETRIAAFFEPGRARAPEIWELGLFHALFTETRPGLPPALAWLSKLSGRRSDVMVQFGRDALAAAAAVLWRALESATWDDVIRLATESSARLPDLFQAAEAAQPPAAAGGGAAGANARPPLQTSAEFQELNQLLDQIAQLEHACVRAAEMAGTSPQPGASKAGSQTPASLRPVLPSRLAPVAPLPPPKRPGAAPPPPASTSDTAMAETIVLPSSISFDAYGVPRQSSLASAQPKPAGGSAAPAGWESPLRVLARALTDLPVFPAFRSRAAAWFDTVKPQFTPVWLEPPLTPAERQNLQRHAPDLLERLPDLLAGHTAAALQELAAATAACVANGARELPRYERAVLGVLQLASAGTLPPVVSPTESAALPAPLAALDQSIATVEAARGIDAVILARLLATPLVAHPAGVEIAQRIPRLAALCGLHMALTAGSAAVREQRWFDALRALRPALDAWPQYPALQTQWNQTLQHGLTAELAALQACTVPGGDPFAAQPAVVQGLLDLVQGPIESNRRWLGDWETPIRTALEAFFARLAAPAARAVPLERRLAALETLRVPFGQFAPAAAAAWEEHLVLTRQRRQDLAVALENARAQAALGKLLALWASGEAALGPPTSSAKEGTDLGEAVLRLWLAQTTNAIDQLAAPVDVTALPGLIERMLGPLHKLLALHAGSPVPPVTGPAADGAAALSISARDLQESVQAIEADLYHRMLALAGRASDLEPWLAAWSSQSFPALGPWWLAAGQAGPRQALNDFLQARQALHEHRLEDAYQALTGASVADAAGSASAGPADLDRFRPVVPTVAVGAAVEELLEPWQRLKATAAKARAKIDLDDAAAQLTRDLARARRLRDHAFPVMTAALQELDQQIAVREAARVRVAQHQTEAAARAEAGELNAAVHVLQALKADWPATAYPREKLQQALAAGSAQLRQALEEQLAQATPVLAEALPVLQRAAAALESDPQRDIFGPGIERRPPGPAGAPGGERWEVLLARIFQRCIAAQNHRRYGVALLAGLQSGALPADAPFWVALLRQDRRAVEPPSASLASPGSATVAAPVAATAQADEWSRLAGLPTGAVGPDEWQVWVAETCGLFSGADGAALQELATRLQQKSAELHADDEHLTADLAANPTLTRRAERLKQFTAKWRNGQQADRRRAEADAVQTQAQAALDAALEPPRANPLIRPWLHWQQLRAVAEEAQVVGETDTHADALKAAFHGWLWRAAAGAVLAIGVAAAVILLV